MRTRLFDQFRLLSIASAATALGTSITSADDHTNPPLQACKATLASNAEVAVSMAFDGVRDGKWSGASRE